MKQTLLATALLLILTACGDAAEDVEPQLEASSDNDAEQAYFDDFDDGGDSLASDPEYGEFRVTVDGDTQALRADCIILFDRNGEQLENSSLSATFGVIKFTDENASDWWSGEAMIRAVFSPQDDIDSVDGQYEVPVDENAETEEGDFWMSMNEAPDTTAFAMTVAGKTFDYKTGSVEDLRGGAQPQLVPVTMRWRGPMQGVLADGSDRVGDIEIDYAGLCQIN